ncbi:MAG: Uma2 family endonuclease [Armatimonadetes bacterium]|nr:Uma2 family endonuclease [Armatimonadota bacterium]MDW8026945.1 Uma2 family endonuclease [Armatimonadota bacterium]
MSVTKIEPEIGERRKPPKERMSLQEFLDWTEEDVWAEWENGEVIVMSPASYLHQDIEGFLQTLLRMFLEEQDMGVVLAAPFAMHLPISNRVREPDLLVVLKENFERIKETYLDGPADLVVEIVSEESIFRDRGTKFAEYEIDGVREYWVIDPERKQADFFVLGEGKRFERKLPDKKGFYHSAVLKGFRIKVEWLWQKPLPKVSDALRMAKRRRKQAR